MARRQSGHHGACATEAVFACAAGNYLRRAELYANLKWYDAQVASIVVNIYDTKLTQLKAEFDKQSGSLTEV